MIGERDRPAGEGDGEEPIAMPAAAEAEYVNTRLREQTGDSAAPGGDTPDSTTPGASASAAPELQLDAGAAAEDDPPDPRSGPGPGRRRVAAWLRLLCAAACLTVVVLLFLPALQDGVKYVVAPAAANIAPGLAEDLARVVGNMNRSIVLLVESTPAGAEVEVAGTQRGVTPAVLDLQCSTSDRLEITLRAGGYEPLHHSFACPAEGNARVAVELRPQAPPPPGKVGKQKPRSKRSRRP